LLDRFLDRLIGVRCLDRADLNGRVDRMREMRSSSDTFRRDRRAAY
jgi:hypothetical protein